MKYVIIIADGAGDLPIAELGNRTPLEAAHTPTMDAIAAMGRLGTAVTTPPGWLAGSDVCTMCLLGYDPRKYHTGRAPLEAAAINVPMGEQDWIFRLNLVTVGEEGTPDAGLMLDHSAGAITDEEAVQLVDAIQQHWQVTIPKSQKDFLLRAGVSYRNILVDRTGRGYVGVTTTPPHEIPRRPWCKHLPTGGESAKVLVNLMASAADVLVDHPVNQARVRAGLRPANMAWIWGQGTRPMMPAFQERFGLRGAMITAVDLLAGIARLVGWERLHVPGVTSYHDTDYAAQGRATCDALEKFDIVCCHVEAPDECSHQGDWKTKVAAIEAIDAKVVRPVMQRLLAFGDAESDPKAEGWRMIILPDHYTLCSTRKHDATPVPFAMAGSWVHTHRSGPFTEAACHAADLNVQNGHDLMEFFLRGGMPPKGR